MRTHRIFIGVLSFFVAISLFGYVLMDNTKADASGVSYSGDALITQSIKAKFQLDKDVVHTSINAKTTDGAVLLSGFAKSEEEKSAAEGIAHKVKGVKSVKNEVAVRH